MGLHLGVVVFGIQVLFDEVFPFKFREGVPLEELWLEITAI